MLRRSSRTRWRRVLFASLGLLTLVTGSFALTYTGLTAAVIHQLAAGGLREGFRIGGSLTYMATTLAELEPDRATQIYGFGEARRRADNDFDRGRLAFHDGDFDEAVMRFERLLARPGPSDDLVFWSALAHLRRGEAANCLATLEAHAAGGEGGSPNVCSLPLAQVHRHPEGARRAFDLFAELLERDTGDTELLRWLLSFSALASGDYPQAVAVDLRIEGRFWELFYGPTPVSAKRLRLEERAVEWGVATFDAGKGVAVEDFDGDGDLDLVTGGLFDPLRYYRNDGSGFAERTIPAGFDGIVQPHVITTADFDSDGAPDLFVGSLFHPDRLLRNRGDGSFADVTAPSGLPAGDDPTGTFTWISAWGDVDGDGDLDLFISRWGTRAPLLRGVLGRPRSDSMLLINEGGHFEEATERFGLSPVLHDRAFIGAAFADLDGDDLPELFLSSPTQRTSALLANRQGRRFEVLQRFPAGFTAAVLDFDHDGAPELFQGGFADARSSTARSVFGALDGAASTGRTTLYGQSPTGKWEALDDLFLDELPMGTMGASFGDLDNDGCFEIYLGTGGPEPWFVLPNLLYSGRLEGHRCVLSADNLSPLAGLANLQKGHGIVFFDVDGDGDQDLYSSLGGMWPADRWPNQLFLSTPPAGRRWLALRIRPPSSGGAILGTAVEAQAEAPDGTLFGRWARIDGKTGFGSGPLTAHLGLLDARGVRRLMVYRPGKPQLQIVDPPLDRTLLWIGRVPSTASLTHSPEPTTPVS